MGASLERLGHNTMEPTHFTLVRHGPCHARVMDIIVIKIKIVKNTSVNLNGAQQSNRVTHRLHFASKKLKTKRTNVATGRTEAAGGGITINQFTAHLQMPREQ